MSRMTVAELAAAAEWINETYPEHPLSVVAGTVMTFAEAGQAHALVESGQLPRTAEGVVARIVLRPANRRRTDLVSRSECPGSRTLRG
jgi:hypothetical protein